MLLLQSGPDQDHTARLHQDNDNFVTHSGSVSHVSKSGRGQPSVGLQGEEHVVLAYVEADPLQDSQPAGLQQQQPAGSQALTHRQALGHTDRLQTLHPTQSLVLHKHLRDQTEGEESTVRVGIRWFDEDLGTLFMCVSELHLLESGLLESQPAKLSDHRPEEELLLH